MTRRIVIPAEMLTCPQCRRSMTTPTGFWRDG